MYFFNECASHGQVKPSYPPRRWVRSRRAGGEASGTWFTRRRAESEALKSRMDPGVEPDVHLLWVSSISAC